MTKLLPPTRHRVLIADDDDGVQRLLAILFERDGWLVDRASNGTEALERIRTAEPDVVLLDLMMPVSSGFDVLAAMRELVPAMLRQVIVLTAAAPARMGNLSAFGEVWKVLRKPFDIAELRSEALACADQGRLMRRRASGAAALHARTAP